MQIRKIISAAYPTASFDGNATHGINTHGQTDDIDELACGWRAINAKLKQKEALSPDEHAELVTSMLTVRLRIRMDQMSD